MGQLVRAHLTWAVYPGFAANENDVPYTSCRLWFHYWHNGTVIGWQWFSAALMNQIWPSLQPLLAETAVITQATCGPANVPATYNEYPDNAVQRLDFSKGTGGPPAFNLCACAAFMKTTGLAGPQRRGRLTLSPVGQGVFASDTDHGGTYWNVLAEESQTKIRTFGQNYLAIITAPDNSTFLPVVPAADGSYAAIESLVFRHQISYQRRRGNLASPWVALH